MNERSVLLPILLSGSLKLPLPPRPRKPSSPCDGVEHPSARVFISDSTSKLRLHHIPGDMPLHKDTVLPGLRAAAQVCPKCVERVLTKHQASQEEQGCPCSPSVSFQENCSLQYPTFYILKDCSYEQSRHSF